MCLTVGAFASGKRIVFFDRDVSHYRDDGSNCDLNFEKTVGIACESQSDCGSIVTRNATRMET